MKPYAGVICPIHGEVDIDFNNYMRQMRDANSRWKCPKCGMTSEFNDIRYEELNFDEENT